jgi:tetratricopeptide (TPR) repeat protein
MLNNTKNKNSILIFIIIISSIFTNIFSQTQDIKNINYEKSAFEAFDNYDLQNSIKYFTILINQKPNEKFYIKRGICKYLLQDFKGAISDYDSSIKIKKTAEAYTNKGNVNEYLKNYNKAILDYDTAIKIDPEYPGAYSYKGLYFLYKKNDINQSNIYFKKAIELYNKAIEKNPSDKNIYNRKGKLEIVLKDYKSAINSFDKSLNLKPNIDAYLLKGSVYLNSDNYT